MFMVHYVDVYGTECVGSVQSVSQYRVHPCIVPAQPYVPLEYTSYTHLFDLETSSD